MIMNSCNGSRTPQTSGAPLSLRNSQPSNASAIPSTPKRTRTYSTVERENYDPNTVQYDPNAPRKRRKPAQTPNTGTFQLAGLAASLQHPQSQSFTRTPYPFQNYHSLCYSHIESETPSRPAPHAFKKQSEAPEEFLSLEQKLGKVFDYAASLGLRFHELLHEAFHTPTSKEKDAWGPEDRHSLLRIELADAAVKPSSGLHVPVPTKRRPMGSSLETLTLDWRSFGLQSFHIVTKLHQRFQPLLCGFLEHVATPDNHTERTRRNRPVEAIVSTSMSKLTFSRSPHANRGPLQVGLFNVAANVSYERFRYNSCVGNTPSLPTVLRAMFGLSERAAMHCLDIGRDPDMWFWIVPDNVQNYVRRRSFRLGRENFMNLGMSATFWARTTAADPKALDCDTKQQMRAQCQRDKITTHDLLHLLDPDHERRVLSFQWLWVLGNYVKDLGELKNRANKLLRTEGLRQKVPDEPLDEFLASILDFCKSSGQTGERFHKRMLPVCGDGYTFELLHKIMEHRQLHTSPFHSLRILSPSLAWWHTEWTNDARIIDNHLVNYASLDPSTLGHSASKIGRKLVKEQGKYNYNQATELLYTVADARILDCWRLLLLNVAKKANVSVSDNDDVFKIVASLTDASKLPSLAQFELYAYELHDKYTIEAAIYRAAHGDEDPRVPQSTKTSILDHLDAALSEGRCLRMTVSWRGQKTRCVSVSVQGRYFGVSQMGMLAELGNN
ncbi:hypothetical protein VKT23_014033 [Stygiomarasmius scandens]|uniref:DUF6589 domain-containing protein n=1 Tax=Marasmiellus scandens TaxID=2682957 RepID=A0ABR1J559_9AGAR